MTLPTLRFVVLGLALVSAAGCQLLPSKLVHGGPPEAPEVKSSSRPWPATLSRVAVLPTFSTQMIGDGQRELDNVIRAELGKKLRFELVFISRTDLAAAIHREQFPSYEQVPPDSLRALREKYAVDAVLFTDVTAYRPYRPISMGLRCKLVDISSLDILWSADTILDSGNPDVAASARYYAGDHASSSPNHEVILQSPRRFSAFLAHQIFSTLPPPNYQSSSVRSGSASGVK